MPSSSPAVLSSLMPGANFSGSSIGVPTSPISPGSGMPGTPSVGGNTNPMLPATASGQSSFPVTSPRALDTSSFPANNPLGEGSVNPTSGLGGTSIYSLLGQGPGGTTQDFKGLDKALRQSGYSGGIAALLTSFLQSGAGFNPQVAQALINAMGPSIARGEANIEEQFSATGNRFGSPAAVGLGDFFSQVNLDIGQIFSQMYEQAVTNYMDILVGAKKKPGFWETFGQNFAAQGGGNLANVLF